MMATTQDNIPSSQSILADDLKKKKVLVVEDFLKKQDVVSTWTIPLYLSW